MPGDQIILDEQVVYLPLRSNQEIATQELDLLHAGIAKRFKPAEFKLSYVLVGKERDMTGGGMVDDAGSTAQEH